MALYVDSALLDDVARLQRVYPLAGATTNPSILLAAIQCGQRLSDIEVLRGLLDLGLGHVFMQPVGATADELRVGGTRYVDLDGARVVLKLPMTVAGLEAARVLTREGAHIAFTAVYSVPQTFSAVAAGADWIIPYFGRLRRAGIDACQRVNHMARLVAASQGGHSAATITRILAASMKTPADIVEATLAGAHDITAQPAVIQALAEDPLTTAAIAQFEADWQQAQAALT
jgi:TalC/MipB family fructose-6-phosphate aldolase